jgi:intracellular sulfur oxidation DsrE/DsrF family protein
MRAVLLVSGDVDWALRVARAWAGAGDAVTVVLLDAASMAVRSRHPQAAAVQETLGARVTVCAHDDALRRRGIGQAQLSAGVKVVDLEEVADLVADGSERVVWL